MALFSHYRGAIVHKNCRAGDLFENIRINRLPSAVKITNC
jgi:hypothetical protein